MRAAHATSLFASSGHVEPRVRPARPRGRVSATRQPRHPRGDAGRRRRDSRADRRRTSPKAICCRARREEIAVARVALRRGRAGRTRRRLRRSGAAQPARRPRCGRSSSATTRASRGIGRRLVDELASRAAARRLRDAVRVHARAGLLRADGLLDRAARLAAGEDRDRLPILRAVPHCGQYAVMLPLVRARQSCVPLTALHG